jgi:hypothetical protein
MTKTDLSLYLAALAFLATTVHLSIAALVCALVWLLIKSVRDDPPPRSPYLRDGTVE